MENDMLAQHLESLKREECYRVDAVLKQSPGEVTQRVFFVGDNGAETGPYIRKFIKQYPGVGAAYEHIYKAQQEGRRFKYVPDILECYARNGFLVVVMEHVRGETLQETIYRRDPSLDLAASIFPRLCDAVSELHDEFNPPIIHRDLKPSNIILSDAGLAIIDFGIARELKDGAERDTTHFGTRGFAPPEQFGFGQTTVRSDIYSLGMVLYYCLTETIPNAEIREQNFIDDRIPEPVRRVISHATAFDPADRYGTTQELRADFLNALRAGTAPSEPPSAAQAYPGGTRTAQNVAADQYANPSTNAFPGGQPSDGFDAQHSRAFTRASSFRQNAAAPPWPGNQPAEERPRDATPSGTPEKFRVAGIVWNCFLGVLAVYGVYHYLRFLDNPLYGMEVNSRAYNTWFAFGYLLPSTLAILFTVSDKRRLLKRFPRLAKWRWWVWPIACLGFIAVLMAVTFIVAGAMNPPAPFGT